MSYKFKGIDISTITNTTGGVNTIATNYYTGFPATVATNYNMMRPLSLGYTIKTTSEQVSDSCTASYTDYTNSQTINAIPSGVKKFRYILVGGGGSGSGGSGQANARFNGTPSRSSTSDGIVGNPGSWAQYIISNNLISYNIGSISVTVGAGGTPGGQGGHNDQKSVFSGQANAQGGTGNSGNVGGDTTLVYNSVTYTSTGGAGGNAPNASNADASSGSKGGNNSTATTPASTITSGIDASCPPLSTYGQGGNGGLAEGGTTTYGNVGTAGICRIIWLYD